MQGRHGEWAWGIKAQVGLSLTLRHTWHGRWVRTQVVRCYIPPPVCSPREQNALNNVGGVVEA